MKRYPTSNKGLSNYQYRSKCMWGIIWDPDIGDHWGLYGTSVIGMPLRGLHATRARRTGLEGDEVPRALLTLAIGT